MPISHKEKIIFIHIPKNAGTSIVTSKELDFDKVQHVRYSEYLNYFPELWEKYLKVAIVRNPWDRFVSCFEYAKMLNTFWHSNNGQKSFFGQHPDYLTLKDLNFEEFVIKFGSRTLNLFHQCWVPQEYWICDNNKVMVDVLFRYEEIEFDTKFKKMFGNIGVTNKSTKQYENYKFYYNSKELIKVVEQFYCKDIELFGYSFD